MVQMKQIDQTQNDIFIDQLKLSKISLDYTAQFSINLVYNEEKLYWQIEKVYTGSHYMIIT